ncbi:MAG: 1,4-dihydroxy-6-naphthoate synthase [Bacteroidetes bacterium]|nr:1,4-dihydroxy-6-naphthoate synthase [Bacteroidota bacterium]
MKYTIGFSPCPNDTFIFDALINGKIDAGFIQLEPVLEDVQTLNQWALEGKLDITKLSYGVWPLVMHNYSLLNSGSALGSGVGPLLISKDNPDSYNVENCVIAIPGKNTTAHLLFSLAYPNAAKKIFLRYDEIEPFVQAGKGLGVIIHENRFTYGEKGLHKIVDLGDFWERQTGGPIPLGGIVIKKGIPEGIQQEIDRLIRESIEYAYSKYPELSDYIKQHAQEMSEDVMRMHIDLYVNNYSLNLGQKGNDAVKKLVEVYEHVNGRTV